MVYSGTHGRGMEIHAKWSELKIIGGLAFAPVAVIAVEEAAVRFGGEPSWWGNESLAWALRYPYRLLPTGAEYDGRPLWTTMDGGGAVTIWAMVMRDEIAYLE